MDIRTMDFAHDLKMPLQLICSCAQLLEMEIPRESHAADYLQMLLQSTGQLRTMIMNALEEGQADCEYPPVRIAACNVVALARNVCRRTELFAREKNIRIGFLSNTADFTMQTDGEKIERILQNLLSNAMRYSVPDSEIRVSVNAMGDAVELWVSDCGRGISPGMQDAVFERGISDGSTGCGLAIVRDYAGLLGGGVSLHSEPGAGCVFKVRLPVCLQRR